jgi:hypothetical protein
MQIRKYILSILIGLGLVALAVVPAMAQGNPNSMGWEQGKRMNLAVVGKVTTVSGNTITVADSRTNTVYSVNASNASVTKNGQTSTVSSIVVGDTVMVQGTVNGTSVVATKIYDGVKAGENEDKNYAVVGTVSSISGNTLTVASKAKPNSATTTYIVDASSAAVTKGGKTVAISSIYVGDTVQVQGIVNGTSVKATAIKDAGVPVTIQGNGQPIVAGKVTAISGNTITVAANDGGIIYTIDASNAKIIVGNQSSTISSVSIGDNVIVQGTVNGTSVAASSIIDKKALSNSNSEGKNEGMKGFFGGMMNFFKNLFGF